MCRLAGIVDTEDVRVLQPRGESNLLLEAIGAKGGGEIGVQDFERDRSIVPEIVSEKDRGEAAATELALDAVLAGQRFFQGVVLARRCVAHLESGEPNMSVRERRPYYTGVLGPFRTVVARLAFGVTVIVFFCLENTRGADSQANTNLRRLPIAN